MAVLRRPVEALSLLRRLLKINWLLIAVVATIACVGIGVLYSVADGSFQPYAERHATRLIVGLALIIGLAVTPMRLWLGLAFPVYFLALGGLILIPLIGSEALGARRWLRYGEFSLQPSELMKLALVAALARYYQWLAPERVSRPFWVLLPLLAIAAPVVLVLKQPDLGTAVLFACIGLGIMFLAGVNPLYFIGGVAGAIGLAPYIWASLHEYQRRRVLTFLDPDRDPLGAGYHVLQSKIALGSGGLAGKGYMEGTQGRLNFLPEKQTDFIFTVLGEEWGFVGGVALMCMYAVLILTLLAMAMACRNQFARLIIAGPALSIFFYAAVNIAMVTGTAPVVGVPLPFVSYGGTAMMTLFGSLGLAMCGWVNRREQIRRDDLGVIA